MFVIIPLLIPQYEDMTLTAVINPVVPLNLLFPHQGVICPHSRQSAKYRIVTHKEINNSKNLSKINNEPLFKSTVYVCHFNSIFPPKVNMRHNDAAIDSGCTTHTWPLMAPVQNIPKTAPSATINVKLPKDQIMAQSHHGNVPIIYMPSSAQELKLFPDHTYKPLLSLGQLADSGYTFQENNKQMMLTHPNHKKLCAARCPSSGMYLMSLINPHSAPLTPTVPSMPTLQACSTRFNKGTNSVVTTLSTWPQSQILQCITTGPPFPRSLLHLFQQSTKEVSLHGRALQQS